MRQKPCKLSQNKEKLGQNRANCPKTKIETKTIQIVPKMGCPKTNFKTKTIQIVPKKNYDKNHTKPYVFSILLA